MKKTMKKMNFAVSQFAGKVFSITTLVFILIVGYAYIPTLAVTPVQSEPVIENISGTGEIVSLEGLASFNVRHNGEIITLVIDNAAVIDGWATVDGEELPVNCIKRTKSIVEGLLVSYVQVSATESGLPIVKMTVSGTNIDLGEYLIKKGVASR